MPPSQPKNRVFATVGIDLFAVIALMLLLKQQIHTEKHIPQQAVKEAGENFYAVVEFPGNDSQPSALWYFNRFSQSWVPYIYGPIRQYKTHYFIKCHNERSCYEVDPKVQKSAIPVGFRLWAIPLENKAIKDQKYWDLCVLNKQCDINFHHVSGDVEVVHK